MPSSRKTRAELHRGHHIAAWRIYQHHAFQILRTRRLAREIDEDLRRVGLDDAVGDQHVGTPRTAAGRSPEARRGTAWAASPAQAGRPRDTARLRPPQGRAVRPERLRTKLIAPTAWCEWWAVTVSNRRPSRCKRDALPTELTAPPGVLRPRCAQSLPRHGLGAKGAAEARRDHPAAGIETRPRFKRDDLGALRRSRRRAGLKAPGFPVDDDAQTKKRRPTAAPSCCYGKPTERGLRR